MLPSDVKEIPDQVMAEEEELYMSQMTCLLLAMSEEEDIQAGSKEITRSHFGDGDINHLSPMSGRGLDDDDPVDWNLV